MVASSVLLSIATAIRSPAPRLAACSLTRDLSPADVVQAQLEAFSTEDLEASFQFASPANRRSRGTMYNQILADPAYNVLIGHSRHQILSALALGTDRFTCRVSVRPSEASLQCLPRTATVDVGQRVRISSDAQHVRRCFDLIQYEHSELMDDMCGQAFEVVCHARENRGTNMIGLPSPDGSQDGVWYFPVTVLDREAVKDARSGEAGEQSEEDAQLPPKPREEYAFRWELRRQADHAIAYALGDLMVCMHAQGSHAPIVHVCTLPH